MNGDGVRLGRLTAVGLAIASAVALWDTEFHVVPAAAGLWRGVADVPNSLRILVALLAGAALAYRLRHQPWPVTRPLLWLGLAAAPLVPILSGRASALIAFQRPALALVCAAALAASVARALGARPHAPGSGAAPPAPARRARAFPLREAVLGALAFAFFAWLGRHLPGPAGPQGDEPHYLVQAQSLLSDGDLDLDDEFTQREYRAFFGGTLDAHASPSSPRGTLYSVHTPGLPALLLPAYALQGYRGAQLFVSLLAALTGALVHRLVRDATGQAGLALAAWAVLTCVPPLPLYAVSIYPEVVAAPATALFLLTSRRDPGRLALAGAALAAAALPWMHPKFLPLAALGLGLTVARRGPRAWRAGAVLAFALSLAALFAFFYALYGRASLAAAYGPRLASDVSLARLPWGLLGLLLDRQFGLFVVSPAWALALPGLALVARQRTGDALRALLLAGATLGVGASYGMWWGGACPPGRFVVPALPAFALGLACAARRRPAVAAALGGAGACVLMLAAQTPHALHNRADGESGLLRLLAPALDLDGSLPSFVVGGGEAALLGLTLLAAFALAWSRGARGLLAAGLAYALLAGALRERPLLDEPAAVSRLLDAWDETRVRPVSGTLDVSALTLPLDLPRAPWTLERGDVRRTRRLALPPGLYRLEVDARAGPAPTTVHLSRFEAATDDLSLDWAYLRVDRPLAPFRLPLPLGAPRFCLVVTGVADRTLVTGARLVPLSVVPRRLRPSFPWMAVPAWDRYRVGDDALRITVVDRSEPEDGGFRLAGEWGAFVLETLPGAPIVVRVVRPSPRPDDALYWNERRVALPRERDTTLTLRSDAGAGLGAARALPVWLRAERGWVAFTTAVTTIE